MDMNPDEMREQADELEDWADDALIEADELRDAADEIDAEESDDDHILGEVPLL